VSATFGFSSRAAETVGGGMTNLVSIHDDPDINVRALDFVRGLRMADAEFEAKRSDYYMLLRAMANVVYRARIRTGARLCDPIDFKLWLEEIAEALK
jgi:hypothetical protein